MLPQILIANNIKKHFVLSNHLIPKKRRVLKAVDGVSLSIPAAKTFGLVGESGCGKSTLGRTLIRLYEPTEGEIEFEGQDFLKLKGSELRSSRRNMQMIFQDPYASLNPRMTIGRILSEPYEIHSLYTPQERKEKVFELLHTVGLQKDHVFRYPHEFSGGQKQRICIARALALSPKLIIADEPVSALDVSIQAQILNLLKDLQEKFHLSYLFISHDLSVIDHLSDLVGVMYLGKMVEFGTREELFRNPLHPYTQALLKSIPEFQTKGKSLVKTGTPKKKILQGELPSPLHPPSGCAFHPRCPRALPECKVQTPALSSSSHHSVACFLAHSQTVEPADLILPPSSSFIQKE